MKSKAKSKACYASKGLPKVPGQPRGTDIIPAWLTPGEAVLSPGAAEMLGRGNVQALNRAANHMRLGSQYKALGDEDMQPEMQPEEVGLGDMGDARADEILANPDQFTPAEVRAAERYMDPRGLGGGPSEARDMTFLQNTRSLDQVENPMDDETMQQYGMARNDLFGRKPQYFRNGTGMVLGMRPQYYAGGVLYADDPTKNRGSFSADIASANNRPVQSQNIEGMVDMSRNGTFKPTPEKMNYNSATQSLTWKGTPTASAIDVRNEGRGRPYNVEYAPTSPVAQTASVARPMTRQAGDIFDGMPPSPYAAAGDAYNATRQNTSAYGAAGAALNAGLSQAGRNVVNALGSVNDLAPNPVTRAVGDFANNLMEGAPKNNGTFVLGKATPNLYNPMNGLSDYTPPTSQRALSKLGTQPEGGTNIMQAAANPAKPPANTLGAPGNDATPNAITQAANKFSASLGNQRPNNQAPALDPNGANKAFYLGGMKMPFNQGDFVSYKDAGGILRGGRATANGFTNEMMNLGGMMNDPGMRAAIEAQNGIYSANKNLADANKTNAETANAPAEGLARLGMALHGAGMGNAYQAEAALHDEQRLHPEKFAGIGGRGSAGGGLKMENVETLGPNGEIMKTSGVFNAETGNFDPVLLPQERMMFNQRRAQYPNEDESSVLAWILNKRQPQLNAN